MTAQYHPVSLQVIRGALTFVGFKVHRIRCTSPASDDQPYADYRVSLNGMLDIPAARLTPDKVEHMVTNAFSTDVHCLTVEYDGDHWIAVLRSQLSPDNLPSGAVEDVEGVLNDGEGHAVGVVPFESAVGWKKGIGLTTRKDESYPYPCIEHTLGHSFRTVFFGPDLDNAPIHGGAIRTTRECQHCYTLWTTWDSFYD